MYIDKVKNKLVGKVPSLILEQLSSIKEIDGPRRLSHFLGQASHESYGFTRAMENLNYSETALRTSGFKKYFLPSEFASFARNPQRIANRVYANRMGNGNEASWDGWKHRGMGFIQLTGHDNQCAFAEFICDPAIKENPEIIAIKYPLVSAAWFFTENGLWKVCDRGVNYDTIIAVSSKIQGLSYSPGLGVAALERLERRINGFQDRNKLTNMFFHSVTS
jgi:putative chitinase